MRNILLVLMSFLLAGCAALGIENLPGTISERVSGFDNTKEITMEPAWITGGPIKLNLYKTSKMAENEAILVVTVKGAYNFSNKSSLQINIDGNIVTLESIDVLTDVSTDPGVYNSVVSISAENWSSKRYEVTKDLVKKLIDAKEAWVKVNLFKDYVEGNFSTDKPMMARPAFREFYKKAWEAK